MERQLPRVHRHIFEAIRDIDVDTLLSAAENEIRPILPCLVRMALCAPLDKSSRWKDKKKKILQILSGVEIVNGLVALLSVDFDALEQDTRKEQKLRAKLGGSSQQDSILISQLQHGITVEFERSAPPRKLRLILSELLFVMSQIREPRPDFYVRQSDLFENEVYLDEVSDVVCVAQAELPNILSVVDLAETLLHVKNGSWLLARLVANVADSFLEVCTCLVMNGDKTEEESTSAVKRSEALHRLCDMNPAHTLKVRALCVDHCRLAALCVSLSLQHSQQVRARGDDQMETEDDDEESEINEMVAFVSGLLLGNDPNVRTWFSAFVRNGQKKDSSHSALARLRAHLLDSLNRLIPEEGQTLSEERVVQASAFIRLYCALRGIGGLRFSDDESKALLRLVTCHPPPSATGVRLVTLGLSMLIGCPQLITPSEQERQAVEWIRWLHEEESKFESASGVTYGEMLFLIAIHFHGNQTPAIAQLVCTTLGMKSAVKANALNKLKHIFTQEIFNEQVVTSHAVKVDVTPDLNSGISGYLPIHCIYQLLKSRAFSKYNVPIKDWIYRQLRSTTTPLHPLLTPLIETYVLSILLPNKQSHHTNQPFSEQEILSAFPNVTKQNNTTTVTDAKESKSSKKSKKSKEKEVLAPAEEGLPVGVESVSCGQLLLIYYLLLYEDCLMSNMKTIAASGREVYRYPRSLLAQLPVRHILNQAQRHQKSFAGLFAPMLKLLATHFPHLCLVEDWLDEELTTLSKSPHHPVHQAVGKVTPHSVHQAFQSVCACPATLLLQLESILCLPLSAMIDYTYPLVTNLPLLLDARVPRHLQDKVKTIWMKLNTAIPRRLRVMTVNALRSESEPVQAEYNEDDLAMDPLIVLRVKPAVFRNAVLLEILLRALKAFLQASRAHYTAFLQLNAAEKQTNGSLENDELKNALISAQESAAVQMLLETCLPRPGEKGHQECENNLREIHCLVCSYLHQSYIADPMLAKLVHFQGYPSELLSVTVRGVPSMHICLDFIPELLAQPDTTKRIFAIELVSHLSLHYALPKSLGIAKLALNVMATLLTVLPSSDHPAFYLPTLPAVERICKAFPPLCDDAISLLLQLGHICASHVTATSNKFILETDGLDAGSTAASEPASYEQLHICVQRTFAQIVHNTSMVKAAS